MRLKSGNRIIFIGAIAAIFFVIIYLNGNSANSRNIYRVKEGMTVSNVLKIMGPPIEKNSFHNDSENFFYRYLNSEFASSADFYVLFSNHDSVVVYIKYGN